MLEVAERWVIRGGPEGYTYSCYWLECTGPDTSALFCRAEIGPGMKCIDLGRGRREIIFDNRPGYTSRKGCEAKVSLTSSGRLGVLPHEGWKPGGFGRERKKRA